ncbi:hypothetical protein ACFVX3_19585 [Rhodococcus erythropolis]
MTASIVVCVPPVGGESAAAVGGLFPSMGILPQLVVAKAVALKAISNRGQTAVDVSVWECTTAILLMERGVPLLGYLQRSFSDGSPGSRAATSRTADRVDVDLDEIIRAFEGEQNGPVDFYQEPWKSMWHPVTPPKKVDATVDDVDEIEDSDDELLVSTPKFGPAPRVGGLVACGFRLAGKVHRAAA